ncbi:kex protein [Phaffia rhodozyma]|uniref:Kex protein n=1 Tax=Phaffia rhodozyma TaxID=264483 RepID=A0A0F7SG85_PHARH|nr:kex protein [Phaffia rhodozyma]
MLLRVLALTTLVSALTLADSFSDSNLYGRRLPHHPAPRSYSTHTYYALELSSSSSLSPEEAAALLGTELVEQVGQLKGHYLVRTENAELTRRRDLGYSSVESTWLAKRDDNLEGFGQIRSLEKMIPRQRAKRAWSERADVFGSKFNTFAATAQTDLTELSFLQDTLDVHDPLLLKQWHIVNTLMPENELNVTHVWNRGITGKGVHVALIDDGLDYTSHDLKENFYAEGSYDFNDHNPLPMPRLSDDTHGTRCAGEIGAIKNDVCGIGVAHTSKVAGVRILSGPISDADEAAALNYNYQKTDVYSCSWGPPDDGKNMDAPVGLILKALVNGATNGRDGKGSVFVFAAGNGGGMDDQCNFDGYTNSIYSITIGAVDRKGLHPYYSELCAAVMAVAPSSGSGDHIHTTDVGEEMCSDGHGGTSAAAPLAVGMYALALQVRPDLTWRDIQHITVNAVDTFNLQDPDWELTAAGRRFNYKYGYGKINVGKLVEYAESWKLVKPQAWFESPLVHLDNHTQSSLLSSIDADANIITRDSPGAFIPPTGVSSTFVVTADMLTRANFERLEHVTARVWIQHDRRGDVEVELVSPKGIKSVLARTRRADEDPDGFNGWKFMSMKHWDEDPIGTWTMTVLDRIHPEKNGTFQAWSLQLWGESINAARAVPYTLPLGDSDSPFPQNDPTVSQSVSAGLPLPPLSTTATENNTKELPKPTAHLPSDHASSPGESNSPGLANPVLTTKTGIEDIATDGGTTTRTGSSTSATSAVSSATTGLDEGIFDGMENLASGSTWVYGAGGLVALVGLGGGGLMLLRWRNRRRALMDGDDERGAYGILGGSGGGLRRGAGPGDGEDVAMGMLSGRKSRRGGEGRGKTKELYDAFGDVTESEDEEGRPAGGLGYHDSFLDDDDQEDRQAGASAPLYHDSQHRPGLPTEYNEEEEDRTMLSPGGPVGSGSNNRRLLEDEEGGSSSSGGSWQDVHRGS